MVILLFYLLIYIKVISLPLLLGCFTSELFMLGFVIGAVTVGYYLATSTTLMAGILEGAKEWGISNK